MEASSNFILLYGVSATNVPNRMLQDLSCMPGLQTCRFKADLQALNLARFAEKSEFLLCKKCFGATQLCQLPWLPSLMSESVY